MYNISEFMTKILKKDEKNSEKPENHEKISEIMLQQKMKFSLLLLNVFSLKKGINKKFRL